MTVAVTGANRGLGLAVTSELLATGHTVVAIVRNVSGELSELERVFGDVLLLVKADVSSEPDISAAAAETRRRVCNITHLVNNAAIIRGRGTGASDLRLEDVRDSFAVNTFGPLIVTKHFLPLIRERAPGIQLLNISSKAGSLALVDKPDYSYAMSKAALNMYTAVLRVELAPQGIGVAAVHPGWMHTDMGGAMAPVDPRRTARTIVGLLDGSVAPPSSLFFNSDLKPLPF